MTIETPSTGTPTGGVTPTETLPAERRHHREGAPGWILGAILIVVGLVLMAQNFGFDGLQNWWALFILIPAFGALGNAWRSYQATGSFANTGGSLIGGLFLLFLSAYFLFDFRFDIDWRIVGPAFLILGGGVLLLQALRKR